MTRQSPAEIAALNAAQAKSAAPPEPIMVTVQGPRGETGIQGVQGPTGPRGPVGVTGATGPLGPIGDTGPLGPKGAVGPVGPKGPVGAVGPAGQDGVGPDEKVKLDASDPEAGYLEAKLQPGLNVKFRRSKNGKALVIDATGGGAAISTGGGRGPAGPQGPPGPQGEPGTGGPGSDDQTAAEVPFTPAGPITATNTQEAVEQAAALGGGAAYGDGPPDGDVHAWYYRNDELGTFYVNLGTLVTPDWQPIAALTNASSDAGLQVSVSNVVSLFGAALEVNAGPDPVGADYLSGEDDPSAGAGVAAPVPALYLRRTPGVVGELWLKTGAADTDWTQLGTGGGTPAADPGAPPAAIADPTLATAEDVALAYNDLQAWADDLRNAMLAAGSLA